MYRYVSSLVGGSPSSHHINRSLSLLLTAMLGGYLMTACPDRYLRLFQHPILQFAVVLMLFNLDQGSTGWKIPESWMVFDTLIVVLLIQLLVVTTNWWYGWHAFADSRHLLAAGDHDGADRAKVLGTELYKRSFQWKAIINFRDAVAIGVTVMVCVAVMRRATP